MWETIYSYTVLEEGLCPTPGSVQWFKYGRKRDGYFEIETPEAHNCWGNFALG